MKIFMKKQYLEELLYLSNKKTFINKIKEPIFNLWVFLVQARLLVQPKNLCRVHIARFVARFVTIKRTKKLFLKC